MRDIAKLIEMVTPEKVVTMLTYLGYHPHVVNGGNEHFVQYITPDEEDAVIVPLLPGDLDYKRNMRDLLMQVAELRESSVEHLITRLVNPSYDILKWRIAGEEADTGKVSLVSMSQNIANIKQILSTACLDIVSPNQRFHRKTKIKSVNDALAQYKFGQTEYGSFLVNILCPLGDYNFAFFGMEEIPLLRKVNLRLLNAYNDIQNSIIHNNKNKIDEEVDAGVYSVNFLDAMTDVYKYSIGKNLSFKVDWSDRIPFDDGIKDKVISVNTACSAVVEEIANKYRPKEAETAIRSFIGKVEYLGSEAEVENRMKINIKAVVLGDDNQAVKINAALDYALYAQIVQEAFDEGMNVKLTGEYSKSGNRHMLSNASIELV